MAHDDTVPALIARADALGLTARWGALHDALDGDDWARGLKAARDLRAALDDAERAAVEAARSAGATWEQIGEALGTSRQAAHRKWGAHTTR